MRVDFPRDLTSAWIEENLVELPGPAPVQPDLPYQVFELGLGSWRRARIFAEARLLGWLYAGYQRGIPIRASTGRDLPTGATSAEKSADERWRLLRDQAAGLVIAELAETLTDRRGNSLKPDVLAAQDEALVATEGVLTASSTVTVPAFHRRRAVTPAVVFRGKHQSDLDERRADVADLLERISSGDPPDEPGLLNLPPIRSDLKSYLVDFVHEAIENTRDHALYDTEESPLHGLRFLLVRRIHVGADTARQLAEHTGSTQVGAYFDSFAQRTLAEHQLVEITVADCGPGIAARMEGSSQIYSGDVVLERDRLVQAMRDGESSKPQGTAGAGLGLGNVMRATELAGGFVSIRTGRLELTRDTLTDSQWQIRSRAFVAGTAVSLLWPWRRIAGDYA